MVRADYLLHIMCQKILMMDYSKSAGVMCGQHDHPLIVNFFGFLSHYYHFRSVAPKIPYDTGWVMITYTG